MFQMILRKKNLLRKKKLTIFVLTILGLNFWIRFSPKSTTIFVLGALCSPLPPFSVIGRGEWGLCPQERALGLKLNSSVSRV